MRSKLTDEGVNLPMQWFLGATEVDILREGNRVIVVPVNTDDANEKLGENLELGKNPIHLEVDDAATNHDRYLYDQ